MHRHGNWLIPRSGGWRCGAGLPWPGMLTKGREGFFNNLRLTASQIASLTLSNLLPLYLDVPAREMMNGVDD